MYVLNCSHLIGSLLMSHPYFLHQQSSFKCLSVYSSFHSFLLYGWLNLFSGDKWISSWEHCMELCLFPVLTYTLCHVKGIRQQTQWSVCPVCLLFFLLWLYLCLASTAILHILISINNKTIFVMRNMWLATKNVYYILNCLWNNTSTLHCYCCCHKCIIKHEQGIWLIALNVRSTH